MSASFYILCASWMLLLLSGGGKNLIIWAAFCAVSLFSLLLARPLKTGRGSLLLLWTIWLLACSAFSLEPLNSFAGIGLWMGCFVCYLAASSASRRESALFVKILLWTAGVFSLLVLAGAAFGVEAGKLLLPPNRNYAAAVIACAFGASAWDFIGAERGTRRCVVCGALLLLMLSALLVLKSRGALMGASAGLAFACVQRGRKRLLVWLGGGVLAAALLAPALFSSILKSHDAFRYERLHIWASAFKACADKPLFGWGPGCFERAYLQNNFPAFNGFSYYNYYTGNAHSQLLQQAAETGLAGAALFALFFLPPLLRSGRGVERERAMLMAFAVISLVDGIMALPLIAATMFLLAGLLDSGAGQDGAYPLPAAVAPLALSLFLAAYETYGGLVLSPMNGERYASASASALTPPQAAELLSRAVELAPENAVYRMRLAAAIEDTGLRGLAWPQLARAVELEPNSPAVAQQMALLLNAKGDADGAAAFLAIARGNAARFAGYKPQSGYERALLACDPAAVEKLEAAAASGKNRKRR